MPVFEPRLGVRAIRPLVSGLRALGHDPAPHLAAAGVDASVLADPDARVPMSAGVRLLESAGAALGDDAIGLRLAESADPASFGVAFYALMSSATLGQGLERIARFQRLIHDTSRVTIAATGGRAIVRHVMPGGHPAPRPSAEFIVAAWVRGGRLAIGSRWAALEVRFAHEAPREAREHARYFEAPVRFGAGENALVIAADVLDAPCVASNPGLLAVLDAHAMEHVRQVPERSSFADRARSVLAGELGGGSPTATRLASLLKMSLRTLDRALAAEGTSFRRLLDQLRQESATRALADSRLSISEIAFALGFADLSAFYRAFKRWSGQTPLQFRRNRPPLA